MVFVWYNRNNKYYDIKFVVVNIVYKNIIFFLL